VYFCIGPKLIILVFLERGGAKISDHWLCILLSSVFFVMCAFFCDYYVYTESQSSILACCVTTIVRHSFNQRESGLSVCLSVPYRIRTREVGKQKCVKKQTFSEQKYPTCQFLVQEVKRSKG